MLLHLAKGSSEILPSRLILKGVEVGTVASNTNNNKAKTGGGRGSQLKSKFFTANIFALSFVWGGMGETRPSVNYAKDWLDQLFPFSGIVWSGKGFHLGCDHYRAFNNQFPGKLKKEGRDFQFGKRARPCKLCDSFLILFQ